MKFSHRHILSCLAAEVANEQRERGSREVLKLLDIGCGYGGLIIDLLEWNAGLDGPDLEIEVYGSEVYDHRGGEPGYYERLIGDLSDRFGGIDWRDRIRLVAAEDEWPFDEGFFDVMLSNQVIEHVSDLEGFFRQLERCLSPGGVAIHHFPSKEMLVDPHCGIPFAHRVRNKRWQHRWIKRLGQIGFGKYAGYRKAKSQTADEFAEEFVNYLSRYTFYRSFKGALRIANECGLNSNYKYGTSLIREWLELSGQDFDYGKGRNEKVITSILSRFASLTMTQRK